MEEKQKVFRHECSYKQKIYNVQYYHQRDLLELTYTNLHKQKIFKYELGHKQIEDVCKWSNDKRIQDVIEGQQCFTHWSLHIAEESNDLYFEKNYLKTASSQTPIEKIPLDKQEMYALSAFRLIKQCLEISAEYIYANIAHGSIRQYILKQYQGLKGYAFIKTLFEVSKGPHIPQRQHMYDSARFITARIGETIYFNPTRRTFQIIKTIFEKTISGNLFIIGKGGVGKSFSLAFLCIISQIIEQFKIKTKFNPRTAEGIQTLRRMAGHLSLFTTLISFSSFPKIFYVNFKPRIQQYTIISQIIQQISEENRQDFYKITSFSVLINKIRKYYQRYDIQVMFILDQINVYTTQIRKYSQKRINNAQSIQSMTNFILSLQGNVKVVFCSSLDFQREVLYMQSFQYAENIFHKSKSTLQYALKYEDNENNCVSIEIVHTIFFELEMKICAEGLRTAVKKLLTELKNRKKILFQTQYLQEMYSNNIEASDLCILNHHIISKYFRQFKIQDIKFMSCSHEQIERQFCKLKDDIQSYYFSSLRRHFHQHVNKSKFVDQNFVKMEVLIYLRGEARRFLKEQKSSGQLLQSFSLKFDEEVFQKYGNFDLIDQQYALVQRYMSKITIFLDPSIFLQATDHIYLVRGASNFFKQLIDKLRKAQNAAYRGIIEDTVVKILAQSDQSRQVRLIMIKEYKIIKGNYTFVNIQPNMYGLDLTKNLKKLMKIAKDKQVKEDNFICAYPIEKRNGKKMNKVNFISQNLWIIDIMLLNWISQQSYNIITIELTITKQISVLKYKIQSTFHFFKKALGNLSPNDVSHKIVAPTSTIIEYFGLAHKRYDPKFENQLQICLNKFKDTTKEKYRVEIQLLPIEDFKVDFLNATEKWKEKTEYLYIWQMLEEDRQTYMRKPQQL